MLLYGSPRAAFILLHNTGRISQRLVCYLSELHLNITSTFSIEVTTVLLPISHHPYHKFVHPEHWNNYDLCIQSIIHLETGK